MLNAGINIRYDPKVEEFLIAKGLRFIVLKSSRSVRI